jgi:hypothetical protein
MWFDVAKELLHGLIAQIARVTVEAIRNAATRKPLRL